MIENLTDWVQAAVSYITMIKYLLKGLLWLIPKVEKSLKKKRKHRKK